MPIYSNPPSGKRSAAFLPEGLSSRVFTSPSPDPDEPAPEGSQSRSGTGSPFPPDGSLDATEPFPGDLFRVPIPDWLFDKMPGTSDSALRALLGLIRLSFRFEPERFTWVQSERSFTRAEVERQSGLSSQGTRDGLSELREAGYVSADESGRCYEYELEVDVPTSRYTYVPTALLEEAPELKGTEVRLVLAVLRATWGWTFIIDGNDQGRESALAHQRWARLSISELARRTGRSETAVKSAASDLQGRYLERLRPTGGTYYYRFLPEAVTSMEDAEADSSAEESADSGPLCIPVKKKKQAVLSMGISNDLTPHLQRSDPPTIIERVFPREAQQSARARSSESGGGSSPQTESGAVPEDPPPTSHTRETKPTQHTEPHSSQKSPRASDRDPSPSRSEPTEKGEKGEKELDLDRFPERLQTLGQFLVTAGVRPRCIPRLLTRFSAKRIEANIQLYRRRAPSVDRPGAWLYTAITEGYALPSPSQGEASQGGASNGQEGHSGTQDSPLPKPGAKVSETRKRELVRQGLAREADFDKFNDYDNPDRKQHFFQLDKSGRSRRRKERREDSPR